MSVFQSCASCGTEIHAMGDGTGAQKDEHGKTSGLVALSDGRWYCMSCLPPIYDPETNEDTVTKELDMKKSFETYCVSCAGAAQVCYNGTWYCGKCLPVKVTKTCVVCGVERKGVESKKSGILHDGKGGVLGFFGGFDGHYYCKNCVHDPTEKTERQGRIPITGSSRVHITGNTEIPQSNDSINHPAHYNTGNIEVIDVIEDAGFGEGFVVGNALKYLLRAKHKGNEIDDMKKARWYIDRRIQQLEGKKS